MHRFCLHLRSATFARIVLAAAAYCCFGSSQASAGCGDHVIALSSLSPEQRSFFVRMMISGGCRGSVHSDTGVPACWRCPFSPSDEGPCRGPYCSNERLPEGVPVSPAPTPTIDPWSMLLHGIQLQELTLAGYLRLADDFTAIPRIDFIFHPPRAA
jgi:hypothetical protein